VDADVSFSLTVTYGTGGSAVTLLSSFDGSQAINKEISASSLTYDMAGQSADYVLTFGSSSAAATFAGADVAIVNTVTQKITLPARGSANIKTITIKIQNADTVSDTYSIHFTVRQKERSGARSVESIQTQEANGDPGIADSCLTIVLLA
jgi:hypothetical protein